MQKQNIQDLFWTFKKRNVNLGQQPAMFSISESLILFKCENDDLDFLEEYQKWASSYPIFGFLCTGYPNLCSTYFENCIWLVVALWAIQLRMVTSSLALK